MRDHSLALRDRLFRAGGDRGDVPGWVLVTVMSAGIVAALVAVAGDKLRQVFLAAIDKVAP
ncbi:MAG: hypothetical protein ACXV5Q_13835 [Frankiaceae bacterium]